MFYLYADGELLYYPLDDTTNVVDPKLTLEIGKAGSLEFGLPPTNKFYDKMQKMRTVVTVELDDMEIFRGRVISSERNFNNVRKLYCEGDLAHLVDSTQKGEAFTGTTHELFATMVQKRNERVEPYKQFSVGNVTIDDRDIVIAGKSDETEDPETGDFDYKQIAINSFVNEWQTSYDYIQSCLIDYCGGYLRTRKDGDTSYLDLVTSYGNTAQQEIAFGKNMLDMTEEVNVDDLVTVPIPLGEDNLTVAEVNGGSDELVDADAVSEYGRIVRTHTFEEVNDAQTLLENGLRYLESKANVPITVTIKAVDLHLLNPGIVEIHLDDTVHVKSAPHSIVDDMVCSKIEYDLSNASNNVYTFGNPKQTLTERYRKDARKAASSGGGSGGAGGSAGAVAEAAESKANVCHPQERECVSIDGKTLCGSQGEGRKPLHMVSAWAHKSQLVLGQIATDEKSNEITAVPALLDTLDVKGAIITADAMSCQKEITRKATERGADYVFALKENQPNLLHDVRDYFQAADEFPALYPAPEVVVTTEKQHGRIEKRQYTLSTDCEWLESRGEWSQLRGIGRVHSEVTIGEVMRTEDRYYITSLTSANEFSTAVRAHWGVENSLHWCLDMTFHEDYARMRKDHSAENMAVVRHIALNLLKLNPSKMSIARKRRHCSYDEAFLADILLSVHA